MKTLIIASALTLATGMAHAYDYAGGFANPDLYAHYDDGSFQGSVHSSTIEIRPSLAEFYAGNPDVDSSVPTDAYRPIFGERYSSLDLLTVGNPDSSGGIRVSRMEIDEAIAQQTLISQDGV